MSMTRAFAIALTLVACSGKSDPADKREPLPADAAVIDGITSFGAPDPNAHIDDDPTLPTKARPANRRPGRPIEILLRSSPSGAMVSVDGLQVGPTPTYWVGETGAEHEFTFSLRKHALARYRFFPIATGTLHARLDPVANDIDAGVPPAHLVQPSPIPPPETLVAPAPKMAPDAAPITQDAAPIAPSIDSSGPAIGPAP
jgi:hypothetical protein